VGFASCEPADALAALLFLYMPHIISPLWYWRQTASIKGAASFLPGVVDDEAG